MPRVAVILYLIQPVGRPSRAIRPPSLPSTPLCDGWSPGSAYSERGNNVMERQLLINPASDLPSSKQIRNVIRTIYDISKGILVFGLFVALLTFRTEWHTIVLSISSRLSFFLCAWTLEG